MLSETMLGYLPVYERKSKVFNQLINAESAEIQLKYDAIEDFKLQLSIDTATWGLDYYENEYKLQTDYSKSYEFRRSVIKSKMRTNGKCDRLLIKLICDAYTNGDVEVSFSGHIVVKFISIKGIPPNIDDLKTILEEVKPAHLGIIYEFTWLTWNEFDNYNKTFDAWDSLNLTWDEFETYREVI